MDKIPSLSAIRQHIRRNGWNSPNSVTRGSNAEVFAGQCEYASTALSEVLTGTGIGEAGDWSLRVRGWYAGDCSALVGDPCAQFDAAGRHPHSWVVYGGKIVDPTWWQFTDAPAKVYVFEANDPRFIPDPEA